MEDIDRCITKAIRENLDIVFTGTMSSKNPFFNIVRLKKKKLYLASKSNKKYLGDKMLLSVLIQQQLVMFLNQNI